MQDRRREERIAVRDCRGAPKDMAHDEGIRLSAKVIENAKVFLHRGNRGKSREGPLLGDKTGL